MRELTIPKRSTQNLKSVDPNQFLDDTHVKPLISTSSHVNSVDEEVNLYKTLPTSALDTLVIICLLMPIHIN